MFKFSKCFLIRPLAGALPKYLWRIAQIWSAPHRRKLAFGGVKCLARGNEGTWEQKAGFLARSPSSDCGQASLASVAQLLLFLFQPSYPTERFTGIRGPFSSFDWLSSEDSCLAFAPLVTTPSNTSSPAALRVSLCSGTRWQDPIAFSYLSSPILACI